LPDKPYQHWSKGEAEKILNNSPWAKQQEVRIKFDKETQTAAGSYSGVSSAAAAQSKTEVTSQVPADFVFTCDCARRARKAGSRSSETARDEYREDGSERRVAFEAQIKGCLIVLPV